MLANAGREDETVEPPERGDQRPCLAGDAIGEQVDRFFCMWIFACEKHADVAAYARCAEQAGATIEHVLDIGEAAPLTPKIEDNAGIEAAAAGGHDQPVERAEAGGGFDADSTLERAETGAGAKMRGNDSTLRQLR